MFFLMKFITHIFIPLIRLNEVITADVSIAPETSSRQILTCLAYSSSKVRKSD